MLKQFFVGIVVAVLLTGESGAGPFEPLTGNYISLDGSMQHQLKQSGD